MCLKYLKSLFSPSNSAALDACKKQLELTKHQLNEQQKMAAIGLLTAGIAHEIKNPLNFVSNFSRLNIELIKELQPELIQLIEHPEKLETPEKLEKSKEIILGLMEDIQINCQKIQEHGQRAEATVQHMLTQARKENETEKESASINTLLEEYANLAYHGMRATNPDYNIKFEKHLDESLPPINLFPQAIGRVFLNLINNALYAANQKKPGTHSNFMPTITLTTLSKDNNIIIKIKDNGPGIPHEQLKKIFEPLFTTKPTGQGTGLGLSISNDIIKEHKGEIQVNSLPNEYTEFTIILPKE